MTKRRMTVQEEHDFYARPENQEHKVLLAGAGRSSPSWFRSGSHPRPSRKFVVEREPTTAPCRAGSAERVEHELEQQTG